MTVERNKDGSVTIRGNNGTTVVSAISAAVDTKQKERFNRWIDNCARMITPCHHTIKETEDHFLQLCDAIPISQDDIRMKNFMYNVVMNHCIDKLEHEPRSFSFDMTDEEIEAWKKEQDAAYEEIRRSSPERFGLKMRGYYLPRTSLNEVYYENARLKHEEMVLNMELMNRERIEKKLKNMGKGSSRHVPRQYAQIAQQDICFFFEETTGYCQSAGGGDDLMRELIVFMGVTQEDIDLRSGRFLCYISTLRDMGKLPDFK